MHTKFHQNQSRGSGVFKLGFGIGFYFIYVTTSQHFVISDLFVMFLVFHFIVFPLLSGSILYLHLIIETLHWQ